MLKSRGLIDQDTKTWDKEILEDIFISRDVDLILRVPVSPDYVDSWYLVMIIEVFIQLRVVIGVL